MTFLKKFILITSIFCLIIHLLLIITEHTSFNYLIFIPLCYAISFICLPKNICIGSGTTMLLVVSFIRYLIYPILLSIDISNNTYTPPYNFNTAIGLMCFEIFIINFSIAIFNKKVEKFQPNINIEKANIIPIIACCIYFIIVIIYPEAFANKHFIGSPENMGRSEVKISGVISQIIAWSEFLIITYFFTSFYQKYIIKRRKRFYYLSILIILIPCLFFTGSSRLSLLMPLICSIFFLKKVYPRQSNKIILSILTYGIIAIFILSIQKFYGDISSSTIADNSSNSNLRDLLNIYFGGVENICIGLNSYESFGSSIEVFINDFLRNAMGISKYFVENPNNSVTIFNRFFYNDFYASEDQICPTIIEGLLMFGPCLCFIPTLIMTFSISWLDRQTAKSNSIQLIYLYSYVGSLIGWCVPGNLMHLSTAFFNIFIPLYVLSYLNKNKRKKSIYHTNNTINSQCL
jgi:hypothetical protein